jgi:hypothetical protein
MIIAHGTSVVSSLQRWFFQSCLTVCLFVSGMPSAFAEEIKAPRLAIDNPLHKFGTVREGTAVEAQFVLRNAGTAPLEIKKVQPACGCTAAAPELTKLDPGASTNLKVTLNTAGFQGDKVKTVRIYTNDPATPTSVLTLEGTVQEELEVSPLRVSFGDINQSEESVREVLVSVPKESSTKILEASSRSEGVTVEQSDYSENNRTGVRVKVKLGKEVPAGIFRGRIVVRTTDPSRPLVNIPVFARVLGDIALTPSDVSFGLLEAPLPKAQARTVTISSRSNTRFEITGVSVSGGPVSYTVAGPDQNQAYQLTVSLGANANGLVKETLTVRTNHPNPLYEELTLPVYGIVRKKGE